VAKYGQVQPLNPSLFLLLLSTLPSSPAFNWDFCLKKPHAWHSIQGL
jgi:hypothetical protein